MANKEKRFYDYITKALLDKRGKHLPEELYKFHKNLDYTLLLADCGDYHGYLSYGVWCRKRGYFETAYEYLKVAVYDKSDLSRYEMARVCFVLGKYEEAIAYSELHPELYSHNYYKGLSYYKLGRTEECIECLRRVAEDEMVNFGYLDAEAFLKNEFGIDLYQEHPLKLMFPKWTTGLDKPFDETPEVHKKYLTMSAISAVIGILLGFLFLPFAIVGLLPIGYFLYIKNKCTTGDASADNIDEEARKSSNSLACVRLGFSNILYLNIGLYEPLSIDELHVPEKGDYTPNEDWSVTFHGYATATDYMADEKVFQRGIERWELDLPMIILHIREKRVRELINRYSNGEKTDVIRNALKYMFCIEIVDDDVKIYERTLPTCMEIDAIRAMQVKTFKDED